jgi:hypothetical protein
MAGRSGTAVWSPEAVVEVDKIWNYHERVAGRNMADSVVSVDVDDWF